MISLYKLYKLYLQDAWFNLVRSFKEIISVLFNQNKMLTIYLVSNKRPTDWPDRAHIFRRALWLIEIKKNCNILKLTLFQEMGGS